MRDTESLFEILDVCFRETGEYARTDNPSPDPESHGYRRGRKEIAEEILENYREKWSIWIQHLTPDPDLADAIERDRPFYIQESEEWPELFISYETRDDLPGEWIGVVFRFIPDRKKPEDSKWRAGRAERLAKIGPDYFAPDWYRSVEQAFPEGRFGYKVHQLNQMRKMPARFDRDARAIMHLA